MVWLRGSEALSAGTPLDHLRGRHPGAVPGDDHGVGLLLIAGHNAPGGGFAGGLVAGLALIIRYLAAGSQELDEAAPVDAGRVLGAGLIVATLSALAPALLGGKILQSYDIAVDLGYRWAPPTW